MTTTRDLIEETKRYLFSGAKEPRNRLSSTINDTDSSIGFDFEAQGVNIGAELSIDLEVMHVWSGSTDSAVVERGHLGSTASAHAAGALITINPRFSDFGILQALNAELVDLSSPMNGLFRIRTTELTYNSAIWGYDLSGVTDLLEIYEVRYDTPDATREWPIIDRGYWEFRRDSETDDFGSGFQLLLKTGGYSGRQVRVVYKAPFDLLSTMDDIVESTGLPATAMDLPPLGAALRLGAMREVQRNFNEVQGETRRAEEVPSGAQFGAVRGMMMLRDQRIKAEATRLQQQYPVRRY